MSDMHKARKHPRCRRAFMLLLVLVFIVLATTLVLLTAAGTSHFARSSGAERTSILLRQMIDSGIAWARTNRSGRSESAIQPTSSRPIVLEAAGIVPKPGNGEIRVTFLDPAGFNVTVEATFERYNRRHRRVVRVALGMADD